MKEDDLDIYYHIINNKWYVSTKDYKKLKNRIDEVIEHIRKNYSNQDGEIWHEGFEKILNILQGNDSNGN